MSLDLATPTAVEERSAAPSSRAHLRFYGADGRALSGGPWPGQQEPNSLESLTLKAGTSEGFNWLDQMCILQNGGCVVSQMPREEWCFGEEGTNNRPDVAWRSRQVMTETCPLESVKLL